MLTLAPSRPLRGTIAVPGDKSISHRAVMFGALADGVTEITGFLSGADCLSTVSCFRRLGVSVDFAGHSSRVTVHGRGLRGLTPNPEYIKDGAVRLDTGNSGTTTRILCGILAPQNFDTVLGGDDSVNSRPMKRVMTPLAGMGASITSLSGNGCAPLLIRGAGDSGLHAFSYRSPVASAQVKSAILCAGLYADGPVSVTEPSLSRDHTERMLRAFGADVRSSILPDGEGALAEIRPCSRLAGRPVRVPGDISSAAYYIAAASIVPDSEVLLTGVGINPTRAGMLEAARAMGADIEIVRMYDDAEPAADLLVRHAPLHGTVIEGAMIPTLIDELPVLAVMAACAEGRTVIRDAAELKVKETDRIRTVTENLLAMGADVTPTDDGMIIEGKAAMQGAMIHTYGDHRIAMAFAVASLVADGQTVLDDHACASVSYPSFYKDLAGLAE